MDNKVDAYSDQSFAAAYRELAEWGRCDAYGGVESERVRREWRAAGRPDPRPFIVRRANVGPFG